MLTPEQANAVSLPAGNPLKHGPLIPTLRQSVPKPKPLPEAVGLLSN